MANLTETSGSTRPRPKLKVNYYAENREIGQRHLLIATLYTIVIIVSVFLYHIFWSAGAQLRDSGIVVTGKVLNQEVKTDSEERRTYYITYHYDVPQVGDKWQRFIKEKEEVTVQTYKALEFGGRVAVLYVATNPEISQIQQEYQPPLSPPRNFKVGFFFLICYSSFLLPLLILAGGAASIDLWRCRKFVVRGKLAQATLFDRWIQQDTYSKEIEQYCVAYRFDASLPDGRSRRIMKGEINQQAYNRLQIGDTVSVRYLPQKPEECRLELGKNFKGEWGL